MLVIFDIDGTLTRTSEVNARAFGQAFEDVFEVPLPSRNWSDYPRVSASGLLEDAAQRALHRLPTAPERAALKERCIELVCTYLFSVKDSLEMPGARRALARLQDGGHAIALATGDWRQSAEFKLERAGFEVEGIAMASADDASARGEIIRCAQGRAGANHGPTVYVGDELWDLNAAQALGLAVVGLSANNSERLREGGIPDTIPDFEDFSLFETHLMSALQRTLS